MNFRVSHVVLVFVASASFSASAEAIVPGSAVVSEADITVLQDASVGLTITPEANLTVADIKKSRSTQIAKFKVRGGNAAVRFVNQLLSTPQCAYVFGVADQKHKFQVCLKGSAGNFVDNGNRYYKYSPGDYIIQGAYDNVLANSNLTNVGADAYKLEMELVQYTQ
ncbi:hypothetical protein ACET8I_20720 [Aeromonas veronii]